MYWKQWLQTLLSLVVLLGVSELLLPPGELARFAKLVLGLCLMLAVLQPLVLLVNQDLLGVDLAWLRGTDVAPEVELSAERLQWAGIQVLWQEHDQQFAAELEKALAALPGVQKVQADLPPQGSGAQSVRIFLEPYEPHLRLDVQETAAALLRVSPGHIAVLPWP
ncbi:MAG: stage III sporulation protein AF [Limnochordia bacterium]|jgi:stage III sporulation protein AF|nr:stage III sporulation protein AF [Limnochordia bacterium]MDI9465303.1 stage III sporulation protein AF [Bacillota bacterium]NLO95620.1 hypothetical protein [Bacillota bacterium]HAN95623.1 hypothetical protein [Bacillota bacterium]HOB40013.1 stage III sporulation protein AF [Limnochordia bacterium]